MTFAGETGNWTDTGVYLRRSKQIIFSVNLPLGARNFPKSLTLGGEEGRVGSAVEGAVKGGVGEREGKKVSFFFQSFQSSCAFSFLFFPHK